MKIFNKKTKNNKGYAILFTVAVVGIISMITIGLSNTAYKQMILSSVARDSTTAFYQADIGSECALYAEVTEFYENPTGTPYVCAGNTFDYENNSVGGIGTYTIAPNSSESDSSSKCFRIAINKSSKDDTIITEVDSRGYNICNMGNARTVERGIKVTY